MRLEIFLFFLILSLIPLVSVGQSLVFQEKTDKASSIKDIVPEGFILLVFESKLDLGFESSMENISIPERAGDLYKLLIKERKCVITVYDIVNSEKADVQFGQLNNSEYNFPVLAKGEKKYFKVQQVTNLDIFDITDQEKLKSNDNQMLHEKEALLIFNYQPVDMVLDFTSTIPITEWKKEKGRHRLYVKPVSQIITVKTQGIDDTRIIIDSLEVKEVKYYKVYLPYLKPQKEILAVINNQVVPHAGNENKTKAEENLKLNDKSPATKTAGNIEKTINGTATIKSSIAYFYSEPDISAKTSQSINYGEKVTFIRESGQFFYTKYTNRAFNKEGWMLKSDFSDNTEMGSISANNANPTADPSLSGKQATVAVELAYLYSSPDERSRTGNSLGNSFIVRYHKEQGDYIYATYKYKGDNKEGWMQKSDFREFNKSATAISAKAYFYYEPDITTQRTAYIISGQEVKYYKEEGDFIFATFSYKGLTNKGWMLKSQFKTKN
jgi:hypothetical protein